ncbi:hypothetical protein FRC03_008292 [Tulasnella sp. 419]|nr:hypothetical protein FRC03_008292 [Tulasnella sp. 419]
MSSEPSEITSLLPRSGRSTPRKGSTRGTSTGTQATSHHPPPRPIPIRQTPYSTWPIRLSFLLITLLSFVSVGVLVILALNTRFATLLSPYLPRHRSSRVLPMWYGLIASWLSVSTVILFWIPSKSTRISLLASLILLTTDLFLICLVPELLHRESLLTISICIFAILTIGACILSNRIVQAAQDKEVSQNIYIEHFN